MTIVNVLELLGFALVVTAVALLAGPEWAILVAGSGLLLAAFVLD